MNGDGALDLIWAVKNDAQLLRWKLSIGGNRGSVAADAEVPFEFLGDMNKRGSFAVLGLTAALRARLRMREGSSKVRTNRSQNGTAPASH